MHEHPLNKDESLLAASDVIKLGQPLLEHFGVPVDPQELPLQFIEALKQLDPRFQGGRDLVRWELEQDQTQWDEETKRVIFEVAESLRMTAGETPLVGHYDAVIVLGGARQANLDRARYAVESIDKERASFGQLVVAGSNRKLNEAEQANTANYAPGAETEYDLCVGAARMISIENPGLIVGTMLVEGEKAGTPIVIQDVLQSLKNAHQLGDEPSIAAITTQIYQESTALDLARVAKDFGVVYTLAAGNPSDPELVAKRTPATYLTEIIRTLKAAVLLLEAEKQSENQ